MDKIRFISELLTSKHLTAAMKSRVFELAAEEIKRVKDEDSRLWEEINILKSEFEKEIRNKHHVETYISPVEVGQSPAKKAPLLTIADKIHNPKKTAEILKLFRTGNRLKWITHVLPPLNGESFDYAKVTIKALQEFNEVSKYLPQKVAAFISVFLKKPRNKNNKIFFLKDYYDTWWCDEIAKWCEQNPGLHPDTNPILSEKIITPFKKSIEIRNGDDLKSAINYFLSKTYSESVIKNMEIDYSGISSGTRFYTGVDQVMNGIASLFSPILKRKNVSTSVKISTNVYEYNDQFVTLLKISHLNSPCDRSADTQSLLSGDLLAAKEKFHSLCEWSIEGTFIKERYSLPILNSSNTMDRVRKEDDSTDFTHSLIFY